MKSDKIKAIEEIANVLTDKKAMQRLIGGLAAPSRFISRFLE